MPGESTIEWTEATWNPMTGCTKVSPGCAHCYAETFAERWRGIPGHPYEQGFDLRLWPQRLEIPLRWRRPRLVFVNSMSDLFHEEVPDEYIARVFGVMAAAHWHTFQVLTKRPERMAELLNHPQFGNVMRRASGEVGHELPLPNVWLGTSIENRRYVGRADLLRQVPAAVRFISAEPLLGPLLAPQDAPWLPRPGASDDAIRAGASSAFGWEWDGGYVGPDLDLQDIDWLIAGGESGPRCRPLQEGWLRDLRVACEQAGTAYFVKQMGARWARANGHKGKGGDLATFPADLRIRQMPSPRPVAA